MDNFSISNINDASDASDVAAALYKEELNDLKIEKLSNRLTIFSILLPCLIGAILVYGYFDIKERVTTAHDTEQTQVDSVARDFEVKLNAIEVDIAKVKFSFEKEIPELKAQASATREALTLLSDLAAAKAGKDETLKELQQIQSSLKSFSSRVDTIAGQHQTALNILDRTSKETLDIANQNSKNLEKRMEAEMDSKIEAAFDEKIVNDAKYAQELDSKISELEYSLESKLAVLQEAIEILAENKKNIAQLDQNFIAIEAGIKQFKKDYKKLIADVSKGNTDKKYVDSRIRSLKSSLNDKIDQINVSKENTDKKYVDSRIRSLNNKIDKLDLKFSLQDTKPGSISETDLTN